MGTMISFVPQLLDSRGWSAMDLVRRGLAVDTAYKLSRGEINITMDTLTQLCDIFEVESVCDVVEYRSDGNG